MLRFFAKRLKQLHEVKRDERGFTLIELIVVVVIIGILAAIAIPVFLGQRADAADARAQANVREAALAANVYYTEEGTFPPTIGDLTGRGFQQSTPAVTLDYATGTAATADWCVSTPSNGGNVAVWHMTEDTGAPAQNACPAAGT